MVVIIMKRNFKRLFAAILTIACLLTCTGMSASAFGDLGDIFAEIQEMVSDIYTVEVDTTLYSHNDFDRTVTFSASLKKVDAAEYFDELDDELDGMEVLADCYSFTNQTNGGKGENLYVYSITHASKEQLAAFTSAVLPGSALNVEENAEEIGPFRDSYQISETFDLSGLCSEMQARGKFICEYRGFESVISDGGGTVDGNVLTYRDYTYSDERVPVSFAFSKVMEYTVENISLATDISSTGIISAGVAIDFSDVVADGSETGYMVGDSACRHFIEYVKSHEDSAYNHPKLRLEMHEGESSATVEGDTVESGLVQTDYHLVLRTEGDADSVSAVLTRVFGPGNNLSLSEGKVNASNILFDRNSIVHRVDLSRLCEEAGFSASEVSYSFSGSTGSKLVDMSIDTDSADIKDNKATGTASSAVFKAVIDYESLDVSVLVIVILAGLALLCLLAFISKLIRRHAGKKRTVKSADILYEAVKSVALALVPEDQRTTDIEVPSELMNRPTVVIKPKSDDGLDDDDDDPEGVILFSMMLRILLMVQLVLFFFPYFNVSRNSAINSVDTITGLDLFLGFKIGDTFIGPDYFAIVLFLLPLIMLLCLMARRALPKLALPVAISAGSVFSVFYLLNLNNTIYERISPAIDASAAAGAFVSQPASQTGYDYSIVIYVALAVGGVILLLSNILAGISLRRQKREEEMRRFEK